jgi:hypothetical protein
MFKTILGISFDIERQLAITHIMDLQLNKLSQFKSEYIPHIPQTYPHMSRPQIQNVG